MNRIQLLGKTLLELENYMQELGEPAFRGRQIQKWIYQKYVNSFYDMSDLPRELRIRLDSLAIISIPRVLKQRVSKDGSRKFLLELEDKKKVEAVVIPQTDDKDTKYTICVSSQVGCPLNCAFCSTGQSGFQRNLFHYEMIGQVLSANRELIKRLKSNEQSLISNVVFMGMGEPMLNLDEVLNAIKFLNDAKGINIGQRHITVSTAGEVEGILKLAAQELQINLAVSLHTCDNDLRNQLMPINKKYNVEKLINAINDYIKLTGRRVTIEYLLLDNVNMNSNDADKLITLFKSKLVNINLIPYNKTNEFVFSKPSKEKVNLFKNKLVNGGLNVTIRSEYGADIDAACGQLAVPMTTKY